MSYKTKRLVDLFPDIYAADEKASLLYRLLDVIADEFLDADDAVKRMLKSHWINYAEGAALDGLGSIFGATRRNLPRENLDDPVRVESDEAYRRRLKSIVPLFTGGGTRRAVLGAVRSALGLPFDSEQFQLPPKYAKLQDAINNLITLVEFDPESETYSADAITEVDNESQLIISVQEISVAAEYPRITLQMTEGGARRFRAYLEGTDLGVRAQPTLLIPEGSTLVLTAIGSGRLSALLDSVDVSTQFTNIDGSIPALLPQVPSGGGNWVFRAQSALFDISQLDVGDSYDLPLFSIVMEWTRYKPLSFVVHVPYFLKETVETLAEIHNYSGELFVFEGLPPEAIQAVVDQTRAAGVRGSVKFTLRLYEKHDQADHLLTFGQYVLQEDADAYDQLRVGSINRADETHDIHDTLIIGGVFDIARFDDGHGFQD